jgi:hypothetical protein
MAHMQQFYTHTYCVRLERFGLESGGRGLGTVYVSVLRPPKRVPASSVGPCRVRWAQNITSRERWRTVYAAAERRAVSYNGAEPMTEKYEIWMQQVGILCFKIQWKE